MFHEKYTKMGTGGVMTLLGLGVLTANGWAVSECNVLLGDKFKCKNAAGGCGPYGDQLEKVLERVNLLLIVSIVANIIAFIAFSAKGFFADINDGIDAYWSKSYKIFTIVVTAVSCVSSLVAYGAVEVNDVRFLRNKAAEPPVNFPGKINTLSATVTWNFVGQLLLLVVGHLISVYKDRLLYCKKNKHTTNYVILNSPRD